MAFCRDVEYLIDKLDAKKEKLNRKIEAKKAKLLRKHAKKNSKYVKSGKVILKIYYRGRRIE